MQKWEYKREEIKGDVDAELERLGSEGWELASITYDKDWETYFAFFKRPLEADDQHEFVGALPETGYAR